MHTLNPLVASNGVAEFDDLRDGASSMQMDIVLVYSIALQIRTDVNCGPLGLLTLGLFPDREVRENATSCGAIFDARTGYVDALAEGTHDGGQAANAWSESAATDQVRDRVEDAAFDRICEHIPIIWGRAVETHANTG